MILDDPYYDGQALSFTIEVINLILSTKQSFKDDPLTDGEMNHIFENMKEVESS